MKKYKILSILCFNFKGMHITILILLAWISIPVDVAGKEKKRPHIVFIAVDDLVSGNYETVAC